MQTMPSRDWEGGTTHLLQPWGFLSALLPPEACCMLPGSTSLTSTRHISMLFSRGRKEQESPPGWEVVCLTWETTDRAFPSP